MDWATLYNNLAYMIGFYATGVFLIMVLVKFVEVVIQKLKDIFRL